MSRTLPLRPEPLRPRPDRLPPDAPGTPAVLRAHDLAIASGRAGYLDPATGLFVMTAAFLAARGYCCDNGCRHCPYDDGEGHDVGPSFTD